MSNFKKTYVRSENDVETVLHHANVSPSSLQKPVQVIYFNENLKSTLLLELDQSLSRAISCGEPLRFLGQTKDKLILCTKDKTYDVKSAQTSNSMLLIQNLQMPDEFDKNGPPLIKRDICSVHHSYLEVRIIKPDTGKIQVLLDKTAYQGPELEPDVYQLDAGYYTTDDLLEEIQISPEELLDSLNDVDALQVKGFWRRLSFEYNFRALSYLINYIDENSWGLSSIPMGETITVLKELLPDYVAQHIFSMYCIPTGAIEDDEQIFELNKVKVCRVLAAALLSHADKFNLNDFMVAWRQGVPEEIDVSLEMIKDLIIIEGNTESTASISYFPEHNLSGNIHERFRQLFKAKPIWNFEEIEPFLRKMSSEKQDVKAILTKYTRTSRKDNVVYYSSKYGK